MKQTAVFFVAFCTSIVTIGCDLLSDPPTGPVATSLIETVYVIDAEGTGCLSCPDGLIPDDVQRILAAAHQGYGRRWIQSRFNLRDEDFNERMKAGDPLTAYFSFRMGEMFGVSFQADGFAIHYEEISCWVWDCYKPRMWRIDAGGDQRWRRRVPFAYSPVRPFVVGQFILYVGVVSGGDALVIVDAETGKVVGHYLPDNDEFSDSAMIFDPAFYREGFIYLRGSSSSYEGDPDQPEALVRSQAKIYILKVNF